MNARSFSHAGRLGLISLFLAGPLAAAPTPPKTPPPGKPAKVEPAEPEVPESVFVVPESPKDGKDPFFPNSTHAYQTPVVKAAGPRTNAEVSLLVNGIIPGDKPLVMINGRTFGPGETAEVRDNSGQRQRVKCLEIRSDSVIVEVNGLRRELRLKPSLK